VAWRRAGKGEDAAEIVLLAVTPMSQIDLRLELAAK
jgi:hypothetical protein